MTTYRDIPPSKRSTGPTPCWQLWLARMQLMMVEYRPSLLWAVAYAFSFVLVAYTLVLFWGAVDFVLSLLRG